LVLKEAKAQTLACGASAVVPQNGESTMIPRKLKRSRELMVFCSPIAKIPTHWLDGIGRSTLCSGTQDCPVCEFQSPRFFGYAIVLEKPDHPAELAEIAEPVVRMIEAACDEKGLDLPHIAVLLEQTTPRRYVIKEVVAAPKVGSNACSCAYAASRLAAMHRLPMSRSHESFADYWHRLGPMIDRLNAERVLR